MTNSHDLSFETFILSMATAGLVALGEIENPHTKTKSKELAAAKHHIDVLEIILLKTKGNLSDRESKLLNEVLFELRLKFVEASKDGSLTK